MMWFRHFTQFVPALMLAAAVALPLSVSGQEQQSQPGQEGHNQPPQEGQNQPGQEEGQAAPEAADKQRENQEKIRTLEVFEIEHRDPQQIDQLIILAQQTADDAERDARQAQAGQPGQTRSGQAAATTAPGRTTVGYRGTSGEKNLVTAVNVDAKILFVRGSEEEVKKVRELVEAFDVEDQQMQPQEYRGVRLIPVRSRDASQVQSTLSQLDLPGEMVHMGEVGVLVLRADEADRENVEQAEKVIETFNARAEDRRNASSNSEVDSQGSEAQQQQQPQPQPQAQPQPQQPQQPRAQQQPQPQQQ